MNGLRRATWLGLALVAAACSDGDPPAPPASFSGPGDVAFVCFDLSGGNVTPAKLSECPNPNDDPSSNLVLHALVTQNNTGELAAVDMRSSRTSIGTQPGRVVDSRADIPGFTFVDVGAVPTNVLVPADHPDRTYVSSFWSETIGTFSTASLRPSDGAVADPRIGEALELGVRPAEMVLDPRDAEEYLYIAAPDAGAVARVKICHDCESPLSPPELLQLSVSDATVTLAEATGSDAGEPYSSDEVCSDYTYAPAPALPLPTLPAAQAIDPNAGARPSSLAFGPRHANSPDEDKCEAVLLAGDENLPVIHRICITSDGWETLEPLQTRAPVSDVVATPEVPLSPTDSTTTSYVYAIDATDGSVMALQDGQILTVSDEPLQRRDRLSLTNSLAGTRALSLEVITPGFPFEPFTSPDNGLECALNQNESNNPVLVLARPSRLRGVYLVVGATDGRLRVFDVHDMDLQGKVDGFDSEDANDIGCGRNCPFFVKRHRPRVVTDVLNPPPVSPLLEDGGVPEALSISTVARTVAYGFENEALTVTTDGKTRDDRLPQLGCLPCRDLSLSEAFPGEIPDSVIETPTEDAPSTAQNGSEILTSDVPIEPDAGIGEPAGDLMEPTEPTEPAAELAARCEEQAAGRVCAIGDPWVASEENWTLTLEGTIPGTSDFRGTKFEVQGDEVVWGVSTSMCGAGVLAGDQLVIAAVPDELTREKLQEQPECLAFIEMMEDGEDQRVLGFEILEASDRELRVADQVLRASELEGLPSRLSELVDCFPPPGDVGGDEIPFGERQAIGYEVRSLNSFVVVGSRAGFLHAVEEIDGKCVDTAALMSGSNRSPRAKICEPLPEGESSPELDECRFNNGHIAVRLEIENFGDLPWESRPFLRISLFPPSDHLTLDAQVVSGRSQTGVLPARLRYSDTDLRLYMIDPQQRGLLPVRVDNFPSVLSSIASQLN